jgi:hypothetical protein
MLRHALVISSYWIPESRKCDEQDFESGDNAFCEWFFLLCFLLIRLYTIPASAYHKRDTYSLSYSSLSPAEFSLTWHLISATDPHPSSSRRKVGHEILPPGVPDLGFGSQSIRTLFTAWATMSGTVRTAHGNRCLSLLFLCSSESSSAPKFLT